MNTQENKIAYITSPEDNFNAWCIYYFAVHSSKGNLSTTHHLSGYGLESLKEYITKNDVVLITGNASINFMLRVNNECVNGHNSFDENLKNKEYIEAYKKHGVFEVSIF